MQHYWIYLKGLQDNFQQCFCGQNLDIFYKNFRTSLALFVVTKTDILRQNITFPNSHQAAFMLKLNESMVTALTQGEIS